MGTRCADHVTPLYTQKLALTSPTGGGRSVGIVRSRTKATEFSWSFMLFFYELMYAVYWLLRWSSYRCCLLDAMCDTCLSVQGVLNSRPHSYFSYHCHRNVNRLRYCSRRWNQLGDIFTIQLPVSRVLVQVTVLKFRYTLLLQNITVSQNTTKIIVLCFTICFTTTCFGPFL